MQSELANDPQQSEQPESFLENVNISLLALRPSKVGKTIYGSIPERNEKCPCGSNKKFKNCCWLTGLRIQEHV